MNFSFAQPAALWLLLLLPLFTVLRWVADGRATQAVTRMAAPRLLERLVSWHGRGRSWFVFGFELLGIGLMIAALARPQWGYTEEESGGSGRSLIIGIDTSKSMLANDLQPDRLTRAKLAAQDLVKKLRGDRIGLMPFAGSAFMYAPITPDTDALVESIDSMDTDIIPRGGSNLARAIDKAVETFGKSDLSGQQVLILFSDGEELEGEAIAAAKRARDARVALVCVAVGTQAGGVVPDPEAQGGYFRDRNGKIVFTRLQRDVLMKLATLTGGLYLPLDSKGVNDSRLELILQKLQRSAMKGKTTKKAVDRYQWPLAGGLGCLVTAYLLGIVARHRAPAVLASPAVAGLLLLVAGAGLVMPVGAAEGDKGGRAAAAEPVVGDPWKFYREGDFANAQYNFERLLEQSGDAAPADAGAAERGFGVITDRFLGTNRAAVNTPEQLQFARGTAAFKAGDFDAAMDAFGSVLAADDVKLRENGHYNLANTVFEQAKVQDKRVKKPTLKYMDGLIRRLENSLEHFQETLVLNSDNAAARKNHDAVAELIKKLKEKREQMAQQQGQGEGQQQGKNKGKGQGKGKSQGKGQGQGEGEGQGEGQNQGKGKNGEKNEGGDQKDGESGENGEEEGDGAGGEEEGDDGKGGGKEGEEKDGEAEKAREETNAERDGNIGTQSGGQQPGGKEGEPGEGEAESEDDAVNSATGYSRSEAMDQLKQLSDEDKNVRPRMEAGREVRPAKDW